MLTYKDAITLAENTLAATNSSLPEGDSLILLLEHTIERPFGWVFFYTSRLYRETGNIMYALGGNSPFIIDRHSSKIAFTGTAHPVEKYIAEYEARLEH